jgi:hypothetical protein
MVPVLLIAWAAVAASSLLAGQALLASMSIDDFMRMVEVRDYLAGQSWFDLTQYRLDPPNGVVMHWSRMIDLPIAWLVLGLAPLIGRANAEFYTAALWPLLLLLPTLALAGIVARRLAGETAAIVAVILVAVSAPSIVHFRPGALDHHGAQLLLVLAGSWGAMARGDARLLPAFGGLAGALSLAIGLEMLPAIAAMLAAVGLRWAIEGERAARATSAYGLGFGAGTGALLAATVPPAAWFAPACDALSLVWVAAAALSGGTLALLAITGTRLGGVVTRLCAGAILASLALVAFVLAFPDCLGDPYANMDPRMATLWLDHVSEAQNVFSIAATSPAEFLPIYFPPIAGLALATLAMALAPRAEHTLYLAPLFALLALVAVALWQVRGAASANLLAQALIAVGLVRLFAPGDGRGSRVRFLVAALAMSSPALILVGQAFGAALAAFDPARPQYYAGGIGDCRRPADMAPLKPLVPGRVLSLIDIGPTILYETRHSIFAAPYHRNVDGNRATFDLLLGDDAAARRVIAEKGVDYVAICPGAPEHFNYGRAAPEGLSARLGRGEVPDYLEALPGDAKDTLRVFRVRPEAFLRGTQPR